MPKAIYEPLQQSEVRLFVINGDQNEEALAITLNTYSGLSPPQYFALSYEWGDASDVKVITANGEPLSIPANLWWFLNQLRHSQPNSLFWADSLSINQSDVIEKNEQVKRMGSIYADAVHVLAWIWFYNKPQTSQYEAKLGLLFLKSERWSSKEFDSLKSRDTSWEDKQQFEILNTLFVLPSYWSRRWIVQELVLAKNATLFFGSTSISLNDFHKFSRQLRHEDLSFVQALGLVATASHGFNWDLRDEFFRKTERTIGQNYRDAVENHGAARVCQHRHAFAENPNSKQSWATCLTRYYDIQCGRPHDVLYAMHNLVRDELRLKVDYRLLPIEVLRHALEVFQDIEQMDPIIILALSRHILRQMNLDPEAIISEMLSNSHQVKLAPFKLTVTLRLRGVVTGHVSKAQIEEAKGWEHTSSYSKYADTHGGIPMESHWTVYSRICEEDGFWRAKNPRGLQFWERNFYGSDGVIRIQSQSSVPKMRDAAFNANLSKRYFTARNVGIVNDFISFFSDKTAQNVDIVGCSEFPVEYKDEIWQIPGQQSSLIMRKEGNDYRLISVANISRASGEDDNIDKDLVTDELCLWGCLKPQSSIGRPRTMEIDLPMLLEFCRPQISLRPKIFNPKY